MQYKTIYSIKNMYLMNVILLCSFLIHFFNMLCLNTLINMGMNNINYSYASHRVNEASNAIFI